MHARVLSFFLMAKVAMAAGNADDWRTFHSADGKALEGKLIKATPEAAIITVRNGKSVQVPVTRLSADDQAFVKTWREQELKNFVPSLEILVSSGRNNQNEKYFSDDRYQNIQAKIVVRSREREFTLKGAMLHICMLGEGIEDRNERYCILKETFALDLDPLASKEFTSGEVRIKYDDTVPVLWGYKYSGYVVNVVNANGKLIFTNAIPGSLEKFGENALKAQQNQILDRELIATTRTYLQQLDR